MRTIHTTYQTKTCFFLMSVHQSQEQYPSFTEGHFKDMSERLNEMVFICHFVHIIEMFFTLRKNEYFQN